MSQQATDQRSHSSFSRKPPLRTNTSSSTTFSSMSSMTSASSSVASPTAFSPSFKHEAFASPPPPPHFARDFKESERVFSPTLQYSPTTAAHLPQHLQQQEPVVEPSVLQDNSQRVDTQEAKHDYLDPGHFDTSATSNSSADTVAPGQHALRPTNGAEDYSTAEQQSRTERSSSSSSSSSSLLSESKDSKDPYETPLTAHLGQNEPQKRMLNESGYPFPAVAPQSQRREGQTTKQVNHDPWKHTDDLLAPSSKSTQHNVSSQRSNSGNNTSALSLTKPSPAESGVQQLSASQTPTPTAAGMDRRDSQSSSVSSDSRKLVTSKAPMQSRGGGTVAISQTSSPGNLSKLSSSSSPVASGGLASFSPLSALVEPFSPSSNPVALPSKSSPLPQVMANVGPTHIASTGRAQPSEHLDQHSENQAHHQEVMSQRGAYREEGMLEGSTTSSSGDTGYFSNPVRHAGYGHTHQRGPASATSVQSTSSTDQYQPNYSEERQEARSARQRSWSENEAIENAPGLAYHGLGNTKIVSQSSATGRAPWASSQQVIQEHVESSFSVPAASYGYADPRYPRQLGPYATGGLADNEHYMRGGLPSGVADVRNLPVGQSIDAFDAARYGFGPGSVSDVSTAGAEEISTIFVVGFPEDIQEREFQNMFLFARGFEAATLKIPASTAAARERDAAAAAAVSAIAATLPAFSIPPPPPALDPNHGYGSGLSSAGGSSYDHLNNSLYEETFLATSSGTVGPHGHVENAQRVSSALAAAALTATASTASLANTTNKKQIIGFAKFRSREDALVARDVLSGRKIDPEKGCVLKAEMAKKNLHVKKTGSDIQGSSLPVLRPDLVATPREGTSALDRLAEREREREWRARMAAASGTGSRYESSAGSASHQQASGYREADNEHEVLNEPTSRNSAWSDTTYEAFHSVSQDEAVTSNLASQDRRFSDTSSISRSSPQQFMQGSNDTPSAAQASAAALAARQRALAGTSNFGKTLLQQLDDQEDVTFPLPDPSPGFGASAYSSSGEQGSRRQPPPAALPTATSVSTLGNHVYLDEDYRKLALHTRQGHDTSLPNQAGRDDASGYQPQLQQPYSTFHGANATTPTSAMAALGTGARRFTSPDIVSPTFTDFRQPRTQNRADDNMPISTLYVGGLPSSLPSLAGSVNASQLEDALRNVFARCPGFRRMSFRHKSQGPMCFIEFEDTQHATRALNEIYGHTLGGLVKGGIRLAYSKNPLGVRGSGSNGPDSPTPLSPSYFASDIYTQPGYYGSPSGGHPGAAQVPTPTLHSRSAQYDQHGYPTAPGDYTSPPASQQAFGFNQHPQHFQNRPGAYQSGYDQRHGLDRIATSPSTGPGSAFSPFALER